MSHVKIQTTPRKININDTSRVLVINRTNTKTIKVNNNRVVVIKQSPRVIKIPQKNLVIIRPQTKVVAVGISETILRDLFLLKNGDTGTGDFEFEQDVEVNGTITENGANVYTVSQATRELYVDSITGSDSNNGRTEDTAFATLNKALQVAGYQASADETVITLGAGVVGNATVPLYSLGTIRIVGSDTSDPTASKVSGSFGTVGITHVDNAAFLQLEGFQIEGHAWAIRTRRTRLDLKGMNTNDCFWMVDDLGFSYITTTQGTVNNSFTGRNGTSFPCFNIGRNSFLQVAGTTTISNYDRPYQAREARVIIAGTQTITHRPSLGTPFTFFMIGECELRIQASITADGNNATPATGSSFIFQSTGKTETFIQGGVTFTLDDFDYRVRTADQATIYMSDTDTVNWNETNVNNGFQATIGSIGFDVDSTFGAAEGEWISNRYDSYVSLEKISDIKTSDHEVTPLDHNIPVDTSGGDVTITFEPNPYTGRRITLIHSDPTGEVIINGNGNTINGASGYSIINRYSVTFIFNGTEWNIKGATNEITDIVVDTVSVSNTAAETEIYSVDIPANHLFPKHVLDIDLNGVISNASGSDDITIRIKFNSTVLTTFNANISNVTDQVWRGDYQMTVREIGATGSIAVYARVVVNGDTSETSTIETVDTTGTNTISVTVQWDNAKVANIISLYQGHANHKN